jgi:hypothetical protein
MFAAAHDDHWRVRFTRWADLRVWATPWGRDSYSLWLNRQDAQGDVLGFLGVARGRLRDPSGFVQAAVKATGGSKLVVALHGTATKDAPTSVSPNPVLIACFQSGIVVLRLDTRWWRLRDPKDPTPTVVPWAEHPKVEIVQATLPSLKVSWSTGKAELHHCIHGDVAEFVRSVALRGRF